MCVWDEIQFSFCLIESLLLPPTTNNSVTFGDGIVSSFLALYVYGVRTAFATVFVIFLFILDIFAFFSNSSTFTSFLSLLFPYLRNTCLFPTLGSHIQWKIRFRSYLKYFCFIRNRFSVGAKRSYTKKQVKYSLNFTICDYANIYGMSLIAIHRVMHLQIYTK